ncbi:MAG: hypothetical protein QOI80_3683 [Solirubrobacteraceae bacterium]|nr:hypothetical protein [Solirubrobacteraceae bacterium]
MRQLSPTTNLVLAVLAGLGLLGSLSLDWFATPVTDPTGTDGPVERAAFQVSHVFGTHAKGAMTGTDALGSGRSVLIGLIAAVALIAIAVTIPSVRKTAEDALRVVALAGPVVVIVLAAMRPGTDLPVSLHYGTLVGLVAALLMASAAWQGASMRAKRAAPARPRYGTSAR